MVNVTWYDACAYAVWCGKRLPTETEWEYAACGGVNSNSYNYSGSANIDEVAWYYANSAGSAQAVGLKKPNELGLYDMSGNVWEWCADWYTNSVTNESKYCVLKGGSWTNMPDSITISSQDNLAPDMAYKTNGFRCVQDIS